MILVPGGSEFRFQPRRSRALGAPPSTFHSTILPPSLGSAAMRWIHECGFTHSNLTTVPSSLTGWFWSNSAPNEWWAKAADALAVSAAASTRLRVLRVMIGHVLIGSGCGA